MSETYRIQWFHGTDADLVVAVWVTRTDSEQFHTGLYHRDHGDARVLHFAWDRVLCDEALGAAFNGYDNGLVMLPLDDDDAQTLCALCRSVARKHADSLRYRLLEWQPRFDAKTAELRPPPTDDRHGFTCATFVLAMLRSALIEELLALEEWPRPSPQDADDRWQQRILKILCSREPSPEDAAKVLMGKGARRIQPTDVAGGAMHPREQWPVAFVQARRNGEHIASQLSG